MWLQVSSFHPSPATWETAGCAQAISQCSTLLSAQGTALALEEEMIFAAVATVADVPVYCL